MSRRAHPHTAAPRARRPLVVAAVGLLVCVVWLAASGGVGPVRDGRAGATPHDPPTSKLFDPTEAQIETDFIWLINQRRAAAGLDPLLLAPGIVPVAREWSAHLRDVAFEHRPDLTPYPAAYPQLTWRLAGENVGVNHGITQGGTLSVTSLEQAFFDSKEHRDNILGAYDHVAVGALRSGNDLWITVAFVDFDGRVPDAVEVRSDLHDPVGGFDHLVAVPGGLRADGWAIDPDRAEGAVGVSIDGGAPVDGAAAVDRPDLAALVPPDLTTRRGFVVRSVVQSGDHTVCIVARNAGFGADRDLGCRSLRTTSVPVGAVEGVETEGRRVLVSGWALDPDLSVATSVEVKLDGRRAVISMADRPSTKVPQEWSEWGAKRGFTVSLPDVGPGTHEVCVGLPNLGAGDEPGRLGCRNVRVAPWGVTAKAAGPTVELSDPVSGSTAPRTIRLAGTSAPEVNEVDVDGDARADLVVTRSSEKVLRVVVLSSGGSSAPVLRARLTPPTAGPWEVEGLSRDRTNPPRLVVRSRSERTAVPMVWDLASGLRLGGPGVSR